ncbi:TetR/AcrR family transcriptional regulator [Actinoplanes couchii]|uniref:TetR/AcrR family transcriptional regulator n=1 Tax=Actinoplanes couchii TaxID=403638 RepID=UPI001EF2FBBC|nr:TetR/AcrR family transcriptional regulator [Actinoplanes couchii]MDR6319639.1 AcrR family transcriptional regulator [Actinoplanes couchii]
MQTGPERPRRADAARNAERLLDAAREVFAEQGPDAPLDAIARHAGVGVRTLYRHFPHKEALVRAALERGIGEQLGPVITDALTDEDPRRGLVTLMDATLTLVARERSTLAASASMAAEVSAPVLEAIDVLTERAQRAGSVRADLTSTDMQRIMAMLTNVLWTMDEQGAGWRRYLVLMLDAFDPEGASPLPTTSTSKCQSTDNCASFPARK